MPVVCVCVYDGNSVAQTRTPRTHTYPRPPLIGWRYEKFKNKIPKLLYIYCGCYKTRTTRNAHTYRVFDLFVYRNQYSVCSRFMILLIELVNGVFIFRWITFEQNCSSKPRTLSFVFWCSNVFRASSHALTVLSVRLNIEHGTQITRFFIPFRRPTYGFFFIFVRFRIYADYIGSVFCLNYVNLQT